MTYDIINADDLIDNPSPRCPCLVILDTSASMNGEPIRELNEGLQLFIQSLHEDEVAACSVEIAVLTAGGSVTEVLPFTTAMNVEGFQPFAAGGMTPIGGAVERGLNMLEQRKNEYRKNGVAYYQPWLVVISDGAPNDQWQAAAQKARQQAENRKLVSLIVGVNSADMQILGQFSNRPALRLKGVQFGDFFQWLSASMSRVSASASTSASVDLPARDGWASI